MIDQSLILSDGVISLRPPRLTDDRAIYEAVFESIADINPWMSWAHDNYTIDETQEWLESTRQGWLNGDTYNFIIADPKNGTIFGGSGFVINSKQYRYGNLGYWVRSSSRGKGIAGRAARLVTQFAFEKLGMLRVEIVVAEPNLTSLRVAEKLGAKREGLQRNRIRVGDKVYNAWMHSFIPQDFGFEVLIP